MALVLLDQTVNGNTLTNNSATEYTSSFPFSPDNEAVAFNSSNSANLSATSTSSLQPTGNFTIELWVKTSATTGGLFQSWSDSTNAAGIRISLDGAGKPQLFNAKNTGTSQGTDYQLALSSSAINDNSWHHVAGVYDGVHVTIFVDGTQTGQASWTNGPVYTSPNYVRIGCTNDSGTNASFYTGQIDEVRLWGVARTSTQINNFKSVMLTGSESGLQAYWPFENVHFGGIFFNQI